LQGGGKPALSWGAAQNVTRAKHGTLDMGLVRRIFQADKARLPQYVGAEDAQNGFVLVRIDEVKEGDPVDDAKLARYTQQLRQLTGEELSFDYLADAKRLATIKVNLPETAAQP
jgi:peptidyl-prolyl cis-trans isomerase D